MVISERTAIAERTARAVWTGRLASGRGSVSSGSGALGELPLTWAARTEKPDAIVLYTTLLWVPMSLVPALFVAGEHDPLRPPAEIDRLAAQAPQIEALHVASGHFMSTHSPQLVATLLAMLSAEGIAVRDLVTKQSSLEDIFVNLIHEQRSAT